MFQVGLFDELDSIFPDTNPKEGKKEYQVAAAGGSYAGVHIMFSDLTPGMPITISVQGPDKKYKLFELLPLPVEANTGLIDRTEWLLDDYNKDVIRRAPFMVYDVLRPCTNIIMPYGVSTAMAFRCLVSGEHHISKKWEIQVTHCGITQTLIFTVEEFEVVVPSADKDQHIYVNWIGEGVIQNWHHHPMFTEGWYAYLEKYLRLAHYGRQNMVTFWVEWFFDCKDGRNPILNENKLDRLIEIAEHAGMYWFAGGDLSERKNGDWEATTVQTKLTKEEIPGIGEMTLESMARQIYAYLKKHHLENRWFQSFMDEPTKTQEKVYHTGCQILKKSMPEIPILEATLCTEPIAGTVDIWCPVTRAYEEEQSFFEERVKKGEKVFVYTCLQPGGNYCNRMLDMERIRQVYLGWAPAKYQNLSGFLHWGGNFLLDGMDPYYLSERLSSIEDYETDRKTVLPAGDSLFMFPGVQSVMSSTRLEAHRIGLEDLALIQMAKNKQEEEIDKLVATVFISYKEYEKDISAYRTVRKKLFALCEAIK